MSVLSESRGAYSDRGRHGSTTYMVVCDVCGATVSFEGKPQYLATVKAWNSR